MLKGDTFLLMSKLPDESFDFIFADPPYFLSNDGISCHAGRQVSVNKGSWDRSSSFEEKQEFNERWLVECRRLLKPNGSICVSGTMHNIYSVGFLLEKLGYKILHNITWRKTNPPPNLGCRCLTHSTETILWARKSEKSKHIFNYETMKELNHGKQMKDVIEGSLTPRREKKHGKHPTQKPEYLLEYLIKAFTNEGDYILDPFVGSGTTCVVAQRLGRKSVGIELDTQYLQLAKKRLKDELDG